MRQLLKNRLQAVCLIIGFVIASIAFHYSTGMEVSETIEKEDITNNTYEYGANLMIAPASHLVFSKEDIMEDFLSVIGRVQAVDGCFIYLPGLVAYIDDNFTQSIVDIYVSGDMPKYPIVRGGYPTAQMLASGNRYVVLGVNHKKLTYKQNGKDYIKIEGEPYEVCGYISTNNSRILDNEILLFTGCLGDKLLDCLYYQYISGMVFLSYNSDDIGEVEVIAEQFVRTLAASDEENVSGDVTMHFENDRVQFELSYGAYDRLFSTAVKAPEYRQFTNLIYIFCIMLTIFMFELWILKRKKEFAIRKICGYTNGKLFLMLVQETLIALLAALFISELLMFAIDYISAGIAMFHSKQVYYRFVMGAFYVFFTMLLTCIYPFFQLCVRNPVKLMERADDF